MATFLAIPPVTTAGLAALPAASLLRSPTANVLGTPAATTASDSTTVTLSNAALVLSALNGSANAVPAASTPTTPPAANDTLVGEQSAFAATLALQALFDDPGMRAIRNQADPLYSALIAASHLSDFVPATQGTAGAANVIADIPAPVTPVAATRAIDFYRETARETERPLAA